MRPKRTEPVVLPERIEGADGILLRRWTPADGEGLNRAVAESADHLRPWMAWIAQEPISIAQRQSLIDEWNRQWASGGDAYLGVFLDGRIVGGCGLHRRIAPDGLEIGYWIHCGLVRRGLGTNVACLLVKAALAVPGISHVEIHHDRANVASSGIPRKLGFRLLAEEPDEPEAPAEVGIECRWRLEKKRRH
ncbi:MAG TPA: GNAT family N-acetyltransferase [Solirubrobacteraceae bacterium]|nr:GNAT family N-acetyltransferase [Solirubrobacteraceae bacterium]